MFYVDIHICIFFMQRFWNTFILSFPVLLMSSRRWRYKSFNVAFHYTRCSLLLITIWYQLSGRTVVLITHMDVGFVVLRNTYTTLMIYTIYIFIYIFHFISNFLQYIILNIMCNIVLRQKCVTTNALRLMWTLLSKKREMTSKEPLNKLWRTWPLYQMSQLQRPSTLWGSDCQYRKRSPKGMFQGITDHML